jgi:integrase
VARCCKADPTFPRVTAHARRHRRGAGDSSGRDPKVVQRMLGHASAALTLDVYADLFDSDLDTVADRLDRQRTTDVPGTAPGRERNT